MRYSVISAAGSEIRRNRGYRSDNLETYRTAVAKASDYLPAARAEALQRFREYGPSIRFYERGDRTGH